MAATRAPRKRIIESIDAEAANIDNVEFKKLYDKFYGEDKGQSAVDYDHKDFQT
jgi:hypothetical protein